MRKWASLQPCVAKIEHDLVHGEKRWAPMPFGRPISYIGTVMKLAPRLLGWTLSVALTACSCSGPLSPSPTQVPDSGSLAGPSDAGEGAEDAASQVPVDAGVASVSDVGPSDLGGQQGASDLGSSPSDSGVGAMPSRCEIREYTMRCQQRTERLRTGHTGLVPREVHWQMPLGNPPADGWPVAILFQGSLFTAETFWRVLDSSILGMWNQGLLTKTLLDSGFAVITPEAHAQGFTAWDTNIPPVSLAWRTAPDHAFMMDIFDAIDDGDFGPLDRSRMYAAGISSGGYMSSRMAKEYPHRFRAIAIASASYATCAGPVCSVPDDLPADHLPTLFLHGGADSIVPISTARRYYRALRDLGVDTSFIVEEGTGHAWIDASPQEILSWFRKH